jgi:transcription elongation GreA/GreB family factor
MLNKLALRAAILAKLEADLAQQTAAANLARDEAISEESRPENKYDTHSQEAAYLAEGQARLAKDVADSISVYLTLPLPPFAPDTPIALGAVVALGNEKATSWYLIGPRAGGLEIELEGTALMIITPSSPLGRELVGKRIGDRARGPGRSTEVAILAVE